MAWTEPGPFAVRSITYRNSGLHSVEVNGVNSYELHISGAVIIYFFKPDSAGNHQLILAPGDWHDLNVNNSLI